jgi:adenylate cyclase
MNRLIKILKNLPKNMLNLIVFGMFFVSLFLKWLAKTCKQIPKAFIFAFLMGAFSLFICWFFVLKGVLADIETITYDWRSKIAAYQSFSHHDKNIVLLAADDETTAILNRYPELKIGRWPWQRKVWGNVVNFVSQANPRAIIFDIKFEGSEGDSAESLASDKYFADSIKNNNVVIAIALSQSRNAQIRAVNTISDKLPNNYKGNFIDEAFYEYFKVKTPDLKQDFVLTPKKAFYSDLPAKSSLQKQLFNNITFYQSGLAYDELLNNASKLGVINLKASDNTVFRKHTPLYRLTTERGVQYVPSLPLAGVLAALPEREKAPVILEKNKLVIGKREIPFDKNGDFLINWHGKPRTYTTLSIGKVLATNAFNNKIIKKINNEDLISQDFFKDKIVVIGQTSAGTDIHPTSMSSVYPGTEIITTVLDNILNDADTSNPHRRTFIKEVSFPVNLIVTIIFCFLTVLIIRKVKSNLLKIQSLALLFVIFVGFVLCLFVIPQIRLSLNMTYPLLLMFISGILAYSYQIYLGNKEKKNIEMLFGKFVSPQVLEQLLNARTGISREGKRKVMTVLFSDIRGFTTLSESIPAEEVILTLNEYITEMVEIILKYNGTLDKYIGDAIMAFYNDPVDLPDHPLRAVLTAIEMKNALDKLNEKWATEGRPTLTIGIGINTGEMIVGHMGSPRLVDYTVIGDNVNLTSRIEGLTKEYGVSIIISESTYNEVKDSIECRFLGDCTVKGRLNTVKIFEAIAVKQTAELPVLN